jgi:hypothetical protein
MIRVMGRMGERVGATRRKVGLLEDLESTRNDLMDVYAMVLRKLGDAQSAQWLAATSGFGVESAIGAPGRDAPVSPAQLASAIRQFEAELAHVRTVIANVDSRLAHVTR